MARAEAPEKRKRRTKQERRQIVEATIGTGVSVARVARAHGVNANQVYAWRRLYEKGLLGPPGNQVSLVPVRVTDAIAADGLPGNGSQKPPSNHGRLDSDRVRQGPPARGRRTGTVDIANRAGVPARMILVPNGAQIWIAAGVTDMRRGLTGLSALVQTTLEQNPFCGHVFVFRGRRGDLIKVLWWDGDGLCLFAKRLERGRFVWPRAENGAVSLTRAQLSMLLEGYRLAAPGAHGGAAVGGVKRGVFIALFPYLSSQ
jgi:transposase